MNNQLENIMKTDRDIQNHYANQMLSGQITAEDYVAKVDRLSNAYKQKLCDIMREYENTAQL